jgi:hypothetical protein
MRAPVVFGVLTRTAETPTECDLNTQFNVPSTIRAPFGVKSTQKRLEN